MKVTELEGVELDYWVAKACDYDPVRQKESAEGDRVLISRFEGGRVPLWTFKPSRDWSQGGPIIEANRVSIGWYGRPYMWGANMPIGQIYGAETPLVAAMRCFVASKFGEEVEA